MNRFKVNYISGHDLKYKERVVSAETQADAVEKAFTIEGIAFENSLVSVEDLGEEKQTKTGKIRCNNCMKIFSSEDELAKVIETSYLTGRIDYRLYDFKELINTDDCWEEVINACPQCMTDDYLMDLDNLSEEKMSVTRSWKVYGRDGHRQRESFCDSYRHDFSNEEDGIRIIEISNADQTETNDYSIIRITRNTAEECERELDGQLSDGVFKNSGTGRIVEITSNEGAIEELQTYDFSDDNKDLAFKDAILTAIKSLKRNPNDIAIAMLGMVESKLYNACQGDCEHCQFYDESIAPRDGKDCFIETYIDNVIKTLGGEVVQ